MATRGKVCLVGQPSSGKSTLFNRIIGERKSIVSESHGSTRDRIYSKASWCGEEFILIDTGGITMHDLPFKDEVREQAQMAIDEADVIVFVVDSTVGITANDQMIAKMLYKVKDKVLLCCNKIDDIVHVDRSYEFYNLGLGDPIVVSATHGIGVGDLLDEVLKILPKRPIKEYENTTTFTLIGRPNVGKSSLTNAILGKERVISSDVEGTTRDSIDTAFVRDGINYTIIDTAGLKKKGKIYESIDKYAAIRALDSIDKANVVLCLIDGSVGLVEQDKHVMGYAIEQNKPIVLVVNKWDLHSHEMDAQDKFTQYLRQTLTFLSYAPIVYTSATEKPNLARLFEAIDRCYEDANKKVPTSMLNDVLNNAQLRQAAPSFKGGRVKITYGNQIGTMPPTFLLFVNNPEFMHFSYQRYIENVIRESFGFINTPIKVLLKRKNEKGVFTKWK